MTTTLPPPKTRVLAAADPGGCSAHPHRRFHGHDAPESAIYIVVQHHRCSVRPAGVSVYLLGWRVWLGGFFLRRPVQPQKILLTLHVLFAAATLACRLALIYDTLMLARIAAGAFGGVLAAMTQTVVAELIPFEQRSWEMGIVMSSFAVASVAGIPNGLFLAA